MNVLIITGGSKGIGNAILKKYALKNYTVFSLSRNIAAIEKAKQISIDLTNLEKTTAVFKNIFEELNPQKLTSITLINNAARLGKITRLGNLETDDIIASIQLNMTVPLVLSNLFIKHTEKWKCRKQLFSISSGAAVSPYQGWSVYCASKAAIDMMTKTIVAEQNGQENGVKCVAIYPGVVDTSMQTHIRKTDVLDFKNVAKFKALKENNQLYSAEYVAEKIYEIDIENKLKNGDIIDLRYF